MEEMTDKPQWADEQLLYTVEEAARVLNIGRTTIYALIKGGRLRPVYIGRCCRITRAELCRFVARLDSPPSATNASIARRRPAKNQDGLFELNPGPRDAA